MLQSGLPDKYWTYALLYTQNRTFISKFTNKTAFETIFGYKPDMSHMKPFGIKCWVYTAKVPASKLAARATEGTFLVFKEGLDGYIVETGAEFARTRNVEFVQPATTTLENPLSNDHMILCSHKLPLRRKSEPIKLESKLMLVRPKGERMGRKHEKRI